MSEELEGQLSGSEEASGEEQESLTITKVSGMYKNWFLDYASYVILERAVPSMYDGLKPVQRRILHAMREMEDGRYHKVANIIGQTMKYHPHGDASIGDALVALGQKDLLIDTQGNWGNILTGDSAAAPRYIEARLTKFALHTVFSPKVTEWQSSYDGRGKEPVNLPVKFPLLLAQGVEGIAVGLSTKIMPHNFIELIDGSIAILKGKKPRILPDFPTGGIADFSNYEDGHRGGKIKVRAKISIEDKNLLKITEIPYGTTTSSLIDSIIKANDKGKIKIKKIEDNTAAEVEILVHIASGVSPDKMLDALYAFTDCEVSISPNCCVIRDDRPHFIGVTELLHHSTEHTVDLLRQELEIQLAELQEQWHFANLERIFIEKRIYRDIEEEETWEGVIAAIDKGLKPHTKHLLRAVTEDDIVRLTEIRIKRISKFDLDKAQQNIDALDEKIAQVKHHLAHLIDFAIDYFKDLKTRFKKGRERKTEIRQFENIQATKVVIRNERLYIDRDEGFIGTALRRNEFVTECSDIDDVIVFRSDGKMMVTKVDKKVFVGKGVIHVAIFKKSDKRTIYNMIYRDGTRGNTYMKRFPVTGVTRDKEYDLTKSSKGSKILYFSANPNGEAEVVTVHLRALQRIKKLNFNIDFAELAIKGRGVRGNLVSKHPIKKVELKSEGVSTLAAQKIWFDDSVQKLNVDGRGELVGAFSGDDRILEISQNGSYRLLGFDLSTHFDEEMIHLEKFNPMKPVTAIYWEGQKERFYVKRFIPELVDKTRKVDFISDSQGSYLELISTEWIPVIDIEYTKKPGKDRKPNDSVNLHEFIQVKGLKAMGNQLVRDKVKSIGLLDPIEPTEDQLSEWGVSTEIPKETLPEPEEKSDNKKKEPKKMEDLKEGMDESKEKKVDPKSPELGDNQSDDGQLDLGL
jgi:topoisomerase-4 subunit A